MDRQELDDWEVTITHAEKRVVAVAEIDEHIQILDARVQEQRRYAKRSIPEPSIVRRISEMSEFRNEFKPGDNLVFWREDPGHSPGVWSAGYAIYRDKKLVASVRTEIRHID